MIEALPGVAGKTQGVVNRVVVEAADAGAARTGSLGLVNMRERANLIDADYRLTSVPGQGTEMRVTVGVTSDLSERK